MGIATIALGAVLAMRQVGESFALQLNEASITVDAVQQGTMFDVALRSPRTHNTPAPDAVLDEVLALFGYGRSDLDPRIPPALASAGAQHLIVALKNVEALRRMRYDLAAGRELTQRAAIVTICFVFVENNALFRVRNAFAYGGVYEDPATGAAAAAFTGYLKSLGWPHSGAIEILQGVEMGTPSRIRADIPETVGSAVRISGTARVLASS